jgi:phenylacetate-CoA ligase
MDRGTLQVAGDALRNPGVRSSGVRTTGGSTAEPIRVEVTSGEARAAAADLWYARSWLGVDPADRLFLIWGHSHTLGEGPRSLITSTWRRAKDLAFGYARHSAYDMTDDGLRNAAERMLSFRPTWALGYAVALDRFAQVNAERGDALRGLGLKAVVCTAEAFPRQDSRERLAQLFGCPVVMEYGSVETGLVAHERTPDRYLVFWRHHLLEAVESTDVPGACELLVTSLFHRRTPLVRYRMGDLIVPVEGSPSVRREFRRVLGRCNDVVVLRDGTRIHSEAFTHALKDVPGISRFQAVQRAAGDVVLEYVAPRGLGAEALARLHRRLGRTHPAMKEVVVERVESLPLTVAGKSRPIRHE